VKEILKEIKDEIELRLNNLKKIFIIYVTIYSRGMKSGT